MNGRIRPSVEGPTSDPHPDTGLEEPMWKLGVGGGDSYPERPGEPDCKYYVRTGSCGFGARCRYNHPRNRQAVAGGLRSGGGEYPERVGEPICEYFMKTGYCKFGALCKFHHPRYGGGSASTVSLNYHGYPLRPGEKDCFYYVKMGYCNFGAACKFHHPQPSGISMPTAAPTFYPMAQSHSVPSPVSSWLPNSYVRGPYGSMVVSQGVVQIPGWGPYPPPLIPVASIGTQHAVETGSIHMQLSPLAPAYTGPYSSLLFNAVPSSIKKEQRFPERPGQPECRLYSRTGDCKYGSECRYHHPPEWSIPNTTSALSFMGLPLRSGAPPCPYFAQPSSSSLELQPESVAGSTREFFLTRIPSPENMSSVAVASSFSKGGTPVPQAHSQLSIQSSASLDSGSSIDHVSENPNLS